MYVVLYILVLYLKITQKHFLICIGKLTWSQLGKSISKSNHRPSICPWFYCSQTNRLSSNSSHTLDKPINEYGNQLHYHRPIQQHSESYRETNLLWSNCEEFLTSVGFEPRHGYKRSTCIAYALPAEIRDHTKRSSTNQTSESIVPMYTNYWMLSGS